MLSQFTPLEQLLTLLMPLRLFLILAAPLLLTELILSNHRIDNLLKVPETATEKAAELPKPAPTGNLEVTLIETCGGIVDDDPAKASK